MDRTIPKDLKGQIKFQIVDWFIPRYNEQINLDNSEYKEYGYDIHVYGVTEDGNSVFTMVKGFQPYFYVRAPLHMTEKSKIKKFINQNLLSKLENGCFKYNVPKYGSSGTEVKFGLREKEFENIQVLCVKKNDFWGYSREKRWFLKIITPNQSLFKSMQYIFEEFNKINNIGNWKLYETNIDPFIRYIHEKNIKPTGWLSVDFDKTDVEEINDTNCNYSFVIDHSDIEPITLNKIAPFLIASFDIECTSSSGDFPMAIKTYKRLAQDLCENCSYILNNNIDLLEIFKKILIEDYELTKNIIIHKIETKHELTLNQIKSLDLVKSKINLILEDLNNQTNLKVSDYNEYEIRIINICNKYLPSLKGDPIIQIGTTFHTYGSDKIIYKSLINLGTCDEIEGTDVVQCSTEKELLLKWRNMILVNNPDILTGYNIMGFDFKYMFERCNELKINDQFLCEFGKSSKIDAKYQTKTLSSSALGEVNTYFFDFEGILVIDLYTYVKSPTILTLDNYKLDNVAENVLGEKKVDLKPNEIFSKFKGTSKDRMDIGIYCVQDCVLVNRLFQKMKVLENNIGMSNVCLVPMSYIFHRGQGIKIYSLVMYECSKRDQVIPYRTKVDDGIYEGAIVLNPKTGIYVEDPIVVFDYSSLYPSSMIAENLSHDSHILPDDVDKYIQNDELIIKDSNIELNKIVVDNTNHYYVKYKDGNKSTIPQILEMLIKQRKTTRSKIEYKSIKTDKNNYVGLYNEKNKIIKNLETGESYQLKDEIILEINDTYTDFEKAVFDSLQLAYKITANSLYGQTGAKTSPIYLKSIAECTTATGRNMILKAKHFVEENYNADVIYGDTDSIFCKFPLNNKGKEAVPEAINKGLEVEKAIAEYLKAHKPQALNYEKVLYPFILFSKKRYVGLLYETDPNKCKEKSMGIALKRRDYSKIMKEVYGSIIKKILWDNDLKGSFKILEEHLQKIVEGNVDLNSLIISKTLKSTYKDPTRIAHKVLAERIGERDPGNKPQISDRLAYIYIQNKDKKALQGDRIETKEFILENPDIKPDYLHYIKNQIMNPVVQLYTLCLEEIPNYNYPENYWEIQDKELQLKEIYKDLVKRQNRIESLKEQIVQKLLFDPYIRLLENDYDEMGNIILKKPSSFKKEIIQLDFKSKKNELENKILNIEVKAQTKDEKIKIIVLDNEFLNLTKDKKELKKYTETFEFTYQKNKSKELIVTEFLKNYIEKNIDKYYIFRMKGCAKYVKDFSEIKELNSNDSDKTWLDIKQTLIIIYGPILNYYHRFNITGI